MKKNSNEERGFCDASFIISLGYASQRLDELTLARECVEEILKELPNMNTPGYSHNFKFPLNSELGEKILTGIQFLQNGGSVEKAKEYFEDGLRSIQSEISDLSCNGFNYAVQNGIAMGNPIAPGIYPTPPGVVK